MSEYRARIGRGAPPAEVAAQAGTIESLLDESAAALDQAKVDTVAAFLASSMDQRNATEPRD
jgi:hypothetical protein